jgi:hypothetical protein
MNPESKNDKIKCGALQPLEKTGETEKPHKSRKKSNIHKPMKNLLNNLICLLIFLFHICSSYSQNDEAQSESLVFPEKLWKMECNPMASNIIMQRLPNSTGSLSVDLYKTDKNVSILIGNICDIVIGNNNSTVSFGSGEYLIKPCEGSDEKDIEILSQGLDFVYHKGIGLEYTKGKGIIKMFGKSYELPIDEWKNTLKENSIDGYKKYLNNNPKGLHFRMQFLK